MMKKIFTLLVLCLAAVNSWAYDVKISGVYYKLNATDKTASVTYGDSKRGSYSGKVNIPASIKSGNVTYKVTSIEENAFNECYDLTEVTMSTTVTSIGDYAFYYCMKLTTLNIPESVTSIGSAAFYNAGLTSITLPNTLKTIKDCAFTGCDKATSLSLGNSVETIEESAFNGCDGIPSITIPSSVTSIGDKAFAFMNGVASITVDENNKVYDSRDNCNAIIETSSNTLIKGCKNSTIPSTVTSIKGSAFAGNSNLTSITIPNSITTIGGEAFYACGGLTTVTNYATTPQSLSSDKDFSNAANCTLYVPYGCKSAYEAANRWNKFSSIQEMPEAEAITVSKCGNDSYVTTNALDFTDADIKAYAVKEKPVVGLTFVTLTRVKQVPAGTPIFVFTDEKLSEAKAYNVAVGGSTTLTDWTDGSTVNNILKGSLTEAHTVDTAGETVYALMSTDGKLHRCNNDDLIPAGKAYILGKAGLAIEILTFKFGGATAISNVNADLDADKAQNCKVIDNGRLVIKKNGKKYNAAGQRMQ